MMPRINPYQRLLDEFKRYINEVDYPHKKTMWFYPKNKLNIGWDLMDLWERTKAAEQLGYDVVLDSREDGLYVIYTKKRPEKPYAAR